MSKTRKKKNFRKVAYMCMTPRSLAYNKILEKYVNKNSTCLEVGAGSGLLQCIIHNYKNHIESYISDISNIKFI